MDNLTTETGLKNNAQVVQSLRAIRRLATCNLVVLASFNYSSWQILAQSDEDDRQWATHLPVWDKEKLLQIGVDENSRWISFPVFVGENLFGCVFALGEGLSMAEIDMATLELLVGLIAERARQNLQFQLNEAHFSQIIHDIRNPLGATLNAAQVLAKLVNEDKLQRLSKIINDSSQRTYRLIEHLGDFVRSNYGAGLKCNPFSKQDLTAILDNALSAYQDVAIEPKIMATASISGDAKRLAQLFHLLIENAVQHGDRGHPIFISLTEDRDGTILIIANKLLAPVFDVADLTQPFVRNTAGTGKIGLGLGLYIAKQISLAHSGRLELHIKENQLEVAVKFPKYS